MKKIVHLFVFLLVGCLGLSACTAPQASVASAPEPVVASPAPAASPEWFSMELTDVQTGETFTMNDYAGKVVLLETMAMWCPTCLLQAGHVQRLHEALGSPDDLISVSLDVDMNEDAETLKSYAADYGLDWHVAIAPLLVARALGNLYSAQYLNPPLAPMLIIDRAGEVHQLAYGLKDVEALQKAVEPYLGK